MERCGDEEVQWASVSEKSREVNGIVTSPLGKTENGCMIVVLGSTKARHENGRATREVRSKGICRSY